MSCRISILERLAQDKTADNGRALTPKLATDALSVGIGRTGVATSTRASLRGAAGCDGQQARKDWLFGAVMPRLIRAGLPKGVHLSVTVKVLELAQANRQHLLEALFSFQGVSGPALPAFLSRARTAFRDCARPLTLFHQAFLDEAIGRRSKEGPYNRGDLLPVLRPHPDYGSQAFVVIGAMAERASGASAGAGMLHARWFADARCRQDSRR